MNREKVCDCSACELNSVDRLYSSGAKDASILVIDGFPNKSSVALGEHFKDGAGNWLNSVFAEVQLRKHRIRFTSVLSCPAGKYDKKSRVQREAVELCKVGLFDEIEKMENLEIIVPIHDMALEVLGIDASLMDCRGSVYEREDYVIVPTYHPSFIMRGMLKEQVTWVNDWNKIKEINKDGYEKIVEDFTIFPSKKDITREGESLLESGKSLAIDIESTGINPRTSDIVVTGVGISEEKGISFPKLREGGYEYWEHGGRAVASDILKRLLANNKTIYQNALFDVRFLEEKGYEIGEVEHDTMLLQHVIHPELPRNLGYITSVYGRTPFWKDTLKKNVNRIMQIPDEVLRTYNLRDCVVLHQVLPNMITEAKKQGVYHIYKDISIPLIRPIIEMMNTGLHVNKKRLSKWKKELVKEIADLEIEMRRVGELPDEFSLTSGADIRYYLFGKKSRGFERAMDKYQSYFEAGNKKKKDTKVFGELKNTYNKIINTNPLGKPKSLSYIRLTPGKDIAVDEQGILAYRIAAVKRLKMLGSMRRLRAEHTKEKVIIEKQIKFTELLMRYRKVTKLESTYTKFPIDKDGAVHGSFNIAGTTSGRLSSSGPNLQNIDKTTKKIFVAPPGYVYMNFD